MSDPKMLRKVSIFKDLSDEEAKKIAGLCKEQSFEAGDIIIEEDNPGEALYIIRSGRARVVKMEGGCERNIADVEVNEHVGEMSLIEGDMNTSARVVAEEPTECFVLYKEDFDLLLASDDKLHIKVLRVITRTLAHRLRRTSEDLMVWKLDFNEDF